jgi:glucosamine-6-phosphate deaminase
VIRESHFADLRVFTADTTEEMAGRAADDFAAHAARLLQGLQEINVVFAGAESQGAFHAALRARRTISWPRINAFSVDEFIAPGMPPENAVSAQPRRDLYRHVALKSVNVIDFAAADPDAERARYEALLAAHRPHICCIGIGISGHVALNEPGETDFHDQRVVRIVSVCEESKRQLEQDPNFRALPAIPARGITITIPFLLSAAHILVVVPYALKAPIIGRLRDSPVTTDLPASILKERRNAQLYLDPGSAGLLSPVS